ncbi:MAG: phosphatase PAP2 family protein [Krumholzibacteria bacterium]|nr:phosphatase PAP2 family protein [Candidatus Krumholzibacteria bacterium]
MALINDHAVVLRLFAIHRVAVAGVCLAALATRPLAAASLVTANLAAALVLARLARPLPDERRCAWRLVLPYAFWIACWIEVGWLYGLLGRIPHDPGIAAADLAVFGVHWHVRLAQILPGAAAAEAMHFVYLSYYALVLAPPLVLALRGRRSDCARFTAIVMGTYLMCFTIYVLLPVQGPRTLLGGAGSPEEGAMAGYADLLRRTGDSEGTAFPSSHCAGALAAALAAGAGATRGLRLALLLWAVLIALSTVYTGNHYALDSFAGIVVAVVVRMALVRGPGYADLRMERSPS